MTIPPYFRSDRHALYCGWIMGVAIDHGLPVRPVLDDDGNYTDRLLLTLAVLPPNVPNVQITLVVPEPSVDWRFALPGEPTP